MQMKLLGIISVDFDVTGQLLIIYSAFTLLTKPTPNRQDYITSLKTLSASYYEQTPQYGLIRCANKTGRCMSWFFSKVNVTTCTVQR
jgi:hypothetical protein